MWALAVHNFCNRYQGQIIDVVKFKDLKEHVEKYGGDYSNNVGYYDLDDNNDNGVYVGFEADECKVFAIPYKKFNNTDCYCCEKEQMYLICVKKTDYTLNEILNEIQEYVV